MTASDRLQAELEATSAALQTATGVNYPTYVRLLESFLCGRMTKEELEGALRVVLCDDLARYDLHNKYIGLVLEKLAVVEGEAIQQCQSMFMDITHEESAHLHLSNIQLTALDKEYFTDATKRDLPIVPFMEEEAELEERQVSEFTGAEKSLGRPLLCQLSGMLPDVATLRTILTAWLRAYELDPNSIEDDHLALLAQGMEDYLRMIVDKAKHRTLGEEEVNLNSVNAAYKVNRLPIIMSDLL
ncbi:hypothetical protein PSACC_00406 [Paramicrosporidium saccamoebae]|uniref:Uncharacterized protein n=1 Tax=Paramicrosporidium saccamoebae TaxID=1246581 RepID=A0A2H9TPU8_9FUNG|nr:hypothetical protein PSACC_00406 [Paramicrosporidium saccamoebae]